MLSGRKDKKELLEALRRKKDSKASANCTVGKSIFIQAPDNGNAHAHSYAIVLWVGLRM